MSLRPAIALAVLVFVGSAAGQTPSAPPAAPSPGPRRTPGPGDAGVLRRNCDQGRGEDCLRLFRLLVTGRDIRLSDAEGAALLKRACDGGVAAACAIIHHAGLGVREDPDRAMEYAVRGCDSGRAVACVLVAAFSEERGATERVASARKKATGLASAACDQGDPESCCILALLLREDHAAFRSDEGRAIALLQKACGAGWQEACVELDQPPPGGAARMAKESERFCDDGKTEVCLKLGQMYEEGYGSVAMDPTKAAQLYQKACDKGSSAGCAALKHVRP